VSSSFDRRTHERYDFSSQIEYVVDTNEVFEGSVTDLNNSGLCIFTANPLKEGQEISIKSVLPIPSQTAKVIWVSKHDDFYKIGLIFT
jgi:hypothetical protein